MSKKIILLSGPTASGKSKLAIYLAKKLNGEIINADSMQAYKEFLILSSRPNKKETKDIKHHLYGCISVKKYFSTGEWLEMAKIKINKILKNKKIPIVVGGTGLYFSAITKGLSKIPEIDQITSELLKNCNKYQIKDVYISHNDKILFRDVLNKLLGHSLNIFYISKYSFCS